MNNFIIEKSKNIFIKNLSENLKIFSHEKRKKILYLAHKNENGITTKEIIEKLKFSKKTYDFHIRELRKTKMVSWKKTEKEMIFKPTPQAIKLMKNLQII